MLEVIEKIKNLRAKTHPLLGNRIMELTDIKSEFYPRVSVVPSFCRATFDRRLLPVRIRKLALEKLGVLYMR